MRRVIALAVLVVGAASGAGRADDLIALGRGGSEGHRCGLRRWSRRSVRHRRPPSRDARDAGGHCRASRQRVGAGIAREAGHFPC